MVSSNQLEDRRTRTVTRNGTTYEQNLSNIGKKVAEPKEKVTATTTATERPQVKKVNIRSQGSGGPPAAALITSADSRKYGGPIAAVVITQSAFASWPQLLSKR